MLRDKTGNRLFRKVTVKIVYPDAIFPTKTFVQHAGPKQGFNPDGIDDILMQAATRLDELYPWWEFKYVELAPQGRTARYVFTFAGYRAITPQPEFSNINPQESTTLEPGTTEAPVLTEQTIQTFLDQSEKDFTTEAIKAAVGTTLQDLSSQV